MKRILSFLAVVLIGITAMATTFVVVDGVHVRLRFAPSTKGEIAIGEDGKPYYPQKGQKFEYLGTEGNFYKISYMESVAYISRDFCHLKEEGKKAVAKKATAKPAAAQKTQMVIVDGVNVRLRHAPSTKGEIALNEEGQTMYPKKGSSFKYLGTYGSFYKIDYFGEELYISRDYTHLKTY